jgi:HEXXH motif-containing protein
MLEKIYDALASPAESMDESILSALALAHSRLVFSRLANRLPPEDSWFLPVLEGWQRLGCGLESLWEPAYSQVELELQRPQTVARQSLISAALTMHASGAQGQWSAETEEAGNYRLGRWRLPPCRRIEVSTCESNSLALICDGQTLSIRLNPPDADKAIRVLPSVWRGDFQAFIDEDSPTASEAVKSKLEAGGDTGGWNSDVWHDAFALLQECAPEYAVWAARLIRVIVPVDAPEGHQVSASHWHRRGEVLMSWRLRPEQVAEMLVHEASHQHFFLGGFIGNYDDGSDQATYYSPVVKQRRPLNKILLAYHAFANVLLFFRRCRSRLDGKGKFFVDKETDKLMMELEQLEAPLRANSALTKLGRRLWEPLSSQIHQGKS